MSKHLAFKTIKFFVVLLTFWASQALAIGFGEIKLYSYLNEPLDAEIELLGADEVNLSEVIATLAPAADFEKINLERPYFLTKLRFEIVQLGQRTFISVRTDEPIKRAFLEFLTLLSWPDGRLIRSYTLLFDPPPLNSARHSRRVLNQQAAASFSQDAEGFSRVRQRLEQLADLQPPTHLAAASSSGDQNAPVLLGQSQAPSSSGLERLFDDSETEVLEAGAIDRSQAVAVSVESTQKQLLDKAKALAAAQHQASVATAAELKAKMIETKPSLRVLLPQFLKAIKGHQWAFGSSFSILVIAGCMSRWYFKRLQRSGIIVSEGARSKLKVQEFVDPEFSIRLVLAKQYMAIEDPASAKQVLEAIMSYGNQREKKAAEDLFNQLSAQ